VPWGYFVALLGEMKRKQPILSEARRAEFIGCSVMSLEVQKKARSTNGGSVQLPHMDTKKGLREFPAGLFVCCQYLLPIP
jgi:hypothetical protein